jgi:hypothetical protein
VVKLLFSLVQSSIPAPPGVPVALLSPLQGWLLDDTEAMSNPCDTAPGQVPHRWLSLRTASLAPGAFPAPGQVGPPDGTETTGDACAFALDGPGTGCGDREVMGLRPAAYVRRRV